MRTKKAADGLNRSLFLALVIDLLARPYGKPLTIGAQAAVWAALLDAAVVCWVLSIASDRAGSGGVFRWAGWLVLCAAAGETLTVTYRFLRQSAEWSMPFWLFLVLAAGLGAWAAGLGQGAVSRPAGLLLGLLLLSLAGILVSNLSGMAAERLSLQTELPRAVLQGAVGGFRLSPVLLAWKILQKNKTGASKPPKTAVLAATVCFILLTAAGELVMGSFALRHSQPAYTLARMGSLSVFRRLDSLHAFVWALLLVQKLVFLLLSAFVLIKEKMPQKTAAQLLCAVTAAIFAGAAQISPAESWDMPLTAAVFVLLLWKSRKGERVKT